MRKKLLFSLSFSFAFILVACGTVESAPVTIETAPPQITKTTLLPTAEPKKESKPSLTLEQENALEEAESYLKYSDFSREGLIDQLLYEGYSEETSQWAADTVDVDWMAEALDCAESYIRYSGFSYTGLLDQLDYEGFTPEQAAYGADNCGADWNAEALETAESYLKYSSFSRSGLADQLDYEGFTTEQIEYALEGVGY